jgi:hypothetical protein
MAAQGREWESDGEIRAEFRTEGSGGSFVIGTGDCGSDRKQNHSKYNKWSIEVDLIEFD